MYDAFRQFADSWALLGLFGFFLAACFWAFRPAAKPLHRDTAMLPFRNDDGPKE